MDIGDWSSRYEISVPVREDTVELLPPVTATPRESAAVTSLTVVEDSSDDDDDEEIRPAKWHRIPKGGRK